MANIKKNTQGYGYKYTDLSAINDYIESIGETYFQAIEPVGDTDYVVTHRLKDGKETHAIRGSRVVNAPLSNKSNAAQEWGSALTYARRYSLLLAYGLATEDDDAESLTKAVMTPKERADSRQQVWDDGALARAKTAINTMFTDKGYDTAKSKLAFVEGVLGKETIDTEEDANLVADAIEND